MKKPVRCQYVQDCYLAEELRCYGYMTDCPLYMKSNGEPCSEERFDAAMDKLIAKTRAKHERRVSESTDDVVRESKAQNSPTCQPTKTR